jgi:hypothetical protein
LESKDELKKRQQLEKRAAKKQKKYGVDTSVESERPVEFTAGMNKNGMVSSLLKGGTDIHSDCWTSKYCAAEL